MDLIFGMIPTKDLIKLTAWNDRAFNVYDEKKFQPIFCEEILWLFASGVWQ